MEILTIGHSTRSLEEFVSLLGTNQIRALADVPALRPCSS